MAEDFLHGVEVIHVDTGRIRPIRTQRSSVVGIVGTAGKGVVNKPFLIAGSLREAVAEFGPYRGDGFSLPDAIDAVLDQHGATIVAVNVCNPDTHKTDVSGEVLAFKGASKATLANPYVSAFAPGGDYTFKTVFSGVAPGSIQLPAGVGLVSVKDEAGTATYADVTDYTVSGDGRNILRVDGGSISASRTVTVEVRALTEQVFTPDATAFTFDVPVGAVVVKVQSPDKAVDYVSGTNYSVAGTTVTIDSVSGLTGVASKAANVLVTYTENLQEGEDFVLDADSGEVSRVIAGRINALAELEVDYTHVDPTKVSEADVVGGASAVDGSYTGVNALLGARSDVGVKPKIVIAPRWTQPSASGAKSPVTGEIEKVVDRLTGIGFVDGRNTTDEAAQTDVEGVSGRRIMFIDPWAKDGDIGRPASAVYAGVTARTDADIGFWASPSNKLISGITGTGRAIDFTSGDAGSRANLLNENNISTIIREDGFRTWGNRAADGSFLSVQRTADMIAESIQQAHLYAVDRGITKGLVDAVVESVRAYLRSLQARGAILGGDAWFDANLNDANSVADGRLVVDYDFTPVYPAERVQFRAHMVNDYITVLFGT